MASLRDVRGRMKAITQTLQVTKAMKLISTAKMRKSRRTLDEARPFFDRIRHSMIDVVSHSEAVESDYFDMREKQAERRSMVVLVTSDRGLAGGYNANAVKHAEELCSRLPNPFLVLIGNIGMWYLSRSPYPVLENFSLRSQAPQLHDAQEITDFLISQFLWGMADEVHVVYTRMKSSILLIPESIKILPLDAALFKIEEKERNGGKGGGKQFEYLPDPVTVFDALVPLYVKGIVYGALVESYASEQSARITAMDEASKNADTMLQSLRLAYNRARQAMITQEVSEIVSGAAALEN